jgi:hypothetical protein
MLTFINTNEQYHVINVFVKTRKEQWNDKDEMYYKYGEDSFVIDCNDEILESLYELNNHEEKQGNISCLKIPSLIDAHLGHSDELDWDDDDVVYLKTSLVRTVK